MNRPAILFGLQAAKLPNGRFTDAIRVHQLSLTGRAGDDEFFYGGVGLETNKIRHSNGLSP